MSASIILFAVIALVVLALLIMRTQAAVVFLSLCAGSVLLHYVGNDAVMLANSFWSRDAAGFNNVVRIGILLLPVLMSAVALKRTLHGAAKLFNVIPAVAVGVVGTLFVVPLLSIGTQFALQDSALWQELLLYQNVLVGTGIIVSIFVLVLSHPRRGDKHARRSRGE